MPGTVAQHAQRCCDNYDFSQVIPANAPVGDHWRVIALFYSALQAIDAYLVDQGDPPTDHKSREDKINNEYLADCASILPEYNALKGLSLTARYFPENPIGPADVVRAGRLHATICSHMRRSVGYPLALNP